MFVCDLNHSDCISQNIELKIILRNIQNGIILFLCLKL